MIFIDNIKYLFSIQANKAKYKMEIIRLIGLIILLLVCSKFPMYIIDSIPLRILVFLLTIGVLNFLIIFSIMRFIEIYENLIVLKEEKKTKEYKHYFMEYIINHWIFYVLSTLYFSFTYWYLFAQINCRNLSDDVIGVCDTRFSVLTRKIGLYGYFDQFLSLMVLIYVCYVLLYFVYFYFKKEKPFNFLFFSIPFIIVYLVLVLIG